MTKVAAYLRVSTEGQVGEDKFGLPDQRHSISAFAESQSWEVAAWYADEGGSGATLARPALQNLLAAAVDRQFNMVVVAKIDRIARDLMAQLWIEKELLRCGVELVSVAEPFRGQDPANVLFRQIIGAFAQFEKARITERMSGGRKEKAKRGGYAGGGAPLGYSRTRGMRRLDVDPRKAEAVRLLFGLREKHPDWTLQQLADALTAVGHTTAKGACFGRVQVKRILDHYDFYCGRYRYSDVAAFGTHLPILGNAGVEEPR